ncbi:MAG: restriction endonuclease subunit S, partial [Eikenella corrodens]|nr:restriction endonuclease subunit S [Eikenella corrodens]
MNKQQEPRLRFRDFMGAWEDRMLGKVADVRDGTHDSPIYQNQGIPLVTSKNLTENGLDFSNVSLISQEDYEEINKRSKVESGDILLGLIGTIGKPVLVKSGGYAIKNVGLIKELLEVKNEFLLPLLQSNIFETYVSRKNTGNTQKFLALDGLRSFEFLAPSLPEQTHLGNFFRRLDSQIAESRAVLEKSRQLKKAMLAKMFPANGEKIPKIRFKGFEGEWESRKLGDVVEIVMGQSPSSTSYTDNPSDFILVQGNADMKNGKVCPRVWTTECIKLGAAGDIVMSVR